MFHKCSEKCLCASTPSSKKETVLYCFGEVRCKGEGVGGGDYSLEVTIIWRSEKGLKTTTHLKLMMEMIVILMVIMIAMIMITYD